jgi:hypothetical protein
VEEMHFRIFNNPVINQAVKVFHVPRVWRKPRIGLRAPPQAALGGLRPPPNARLAPGM